MDHDEEETWHMVGGAADTSISMPPTTGKSCRNRHNKRLAPTTRTRAKERRPNSSSAAVAEKPKEAQTDDEVTANAGIVDISSILGAPAVTVVRSNL
jgi:hypothetical protein